MDIRNVDIVPFGDIYATHKSRVVEAIFSLQRSLLDRYIGVEKLPPYPIDLHAPTNQILIKDFIARVTEELGEAYESHIWLSHWVQNGRDTHERGVAEQKLFNFNEEIADAIHFLVEALIFTGITPATINQFINQFNFPEYMPDDQGDIFNNCRDTPLFFQGMPGDFPSLALPHLSQDLLTQGGQRISPTTSAMMAQRMWAVTYWLQIARNALKNKPWKQSQMLSDNKVFRDNMIYAFMELICLCDFLDIQEANFFGIYWAKNQVNHFRITSKY
jgi:hypothetical protein